MKDYSYLLKSNISVIKNRSVLPWHKFKHQIEQFHLKQKRSRTKWIQNLIKEINKDDTFCNWNLKHIAADFSDTKTRKIAKSNSMTNVTKAISSDLPLIHQSRNISSLGRDDKLKTRRSNISSKSLVSNSSSYNWSQSINSCVKKPNIFKLFRTGLKVGNNYIISKIGYKCPIEKTLLGPEEIPPNYVHVLQDTHIAKPIWFSKDLGEISLFGWFDGHGWYGHQISKIVRDFFLNYFEKADNISETKDNFYTILMESYINASNFLWENHRKISKFSGTSALLLLYPHNGSNKIYCANTGDSKCVWYGVQKAIPLSAEQSPIVLSERERILSCGGEIETEESTEFTVSSISRVFWSNRTYPGICVSRSIGDLVAQEIGIINEPEITHCKVTKDDARFIVIASESVWKYLSYETIGESAKKFYPREDAFGASKEIEEKAKMQWKKHFKGGNIDDITVIVIFLSWGR